MIDPYILNRDDWHINIEDTNGTLLEQTYTKDTFDLYLKEKKISFEEIVFHNKIQPEFIKGILMDNKNNLDYVNSLIKYNYKIDIYTEKSKLKSNYYDNSMINTYKDIIGNMNYYPRFCFGIFIDNAIKSPISIDTYIKIALNCGMSENDILTFIKQCKNETNFEHFKSLTKEQLIELIEEDNKYSSKYGEVYDKFDFENLGNMDKKDLIELIYKKNCIKKLQNKLKYEYEYPNINKNTYLYQQYKPPFINSKLLDKISQIFNKI